MGRDEGEEKSKCRRIEFTKEARVACNFCEFSSGRFELRRHEQDQEAVCMERELERLRLLTRRMTGKDLDGLSFAELQLLESQLKGVLLIVKDQKKKVELEEDGRMCKQKQKARDEDGTRGELSAPCIFSARSSSGERPQKQGDEAPVPLLLREFERQNAESMESEFERLWLLNEKMSGRSLDGMTFFELLLLEGQILDAISSVKDQKLRPGIEQYARLLQELPKRDVHWTLSRIVAFLCDLDHRLRALPFQESSEDSITVVTGRPRQISARSARVEWLPIDLASDGHNLLWSLIYLCTRSLTRALRVDYINT